MKFLIFTKYRCSFCDRAKALIEQKGYEYESINIEEDNNIEILLEKNKYARTMPQILMISLLAVTQIWSNILRNRYGSI